MARNKCPEQTVEQILDISEQLFFEQGYEKTTIQDIMDRLKMSKGAIYHHFKGKEEILTAIVLRESDREKELLRHLFAHAQGTTALERGRKIALAFFAGVEEIYDQPPLRRKADDPRFVVASLQIAVRDVAPLFARLLAEGTEDGSMSVLYPGQCAEIFMLLLSVWTDPSLFQRSRQASEQTLRALQALMRQLGADVLTDEAVARIGALYQSLGYFVE